MTVALACLTPARRGPAKCFGLLLALVLAPLLAACTATPQQPGVREADSSGMPQFEVDAAWPQPLPNNWMLGQVSGLAVDRHDHIWVLHRPRTLLDDEKGALATPPSSKCCRPAPAVLEFDRGGKLLRHWGGPADGYEWPKNEHGIYVDQEDRVWIGANDDIDAHVLQFTAEGRFLQQFGKQGSTGGSNSPTQFGRPAQLTIDAAAGEMYIADGYRNRRVIVVDAKTGAYKRHWGAYGNRPDDAKQPDYDPKAPLPQQFGNPVHCVRLSRDELVYVCDRSNNRIQVFRKNGSFVKEFRVEPETLASGAAWDLVLSEDPGQKFMFVADGTNSQLLTLTREDGKLLGAIGQAGRNAGQFRWVHNIGIDSAGNLYTAEVGSGRRVQKFTRVQ